VAKMFSNCVAYFPLFSLNKLNKFSRSGRQHWHYIMWFKKVMHQIISRNNTKYAGV